MPIALSRERVPELLINRLKQTFEWNLASAMDRRQDNISPDAVVDGTLLGGFYT